MKTVHVKITIADEVYRILSHLAQAEGVSVEEWVFACLNTIAEFSKVLGADDPWRPRDVQRDMALVNRLIDRNLRGDEPS